MDKPMKNKKALLITVIIILILISNNNRIKEGKKGAGIQWYYQESTIITSGRDTGSYGCSENWNESCSNIYDGNWDTFGKANSNYQGANFVITYTKPNGASTAIWEMKDGSGKTGIVVPPSCWNYDPTKLSFRVISNSQDSYTQWFCYNSTWQLLINNPSPYIYEEGIRWDAPFGLKVTYTLQGGKWHLISFPLQPLDANVEAVFYEIPQNQRILMDENGIYPNDFAYIDVNKGYWLYVQNNVQFTIYGEPIPSTTISGLDQSRNHIIGYKSLQSTPVSNIGNIVQGYNYNELVGLSGLNAEGVNPQVGNIEPTNALTYTKGTGLMSIYKKTAGALTTLEPQHAYIIKTSPSPSPGLYSQFLTDKDRYSAGDYTFNSFISYANNWIT